MLQVFFWFLQNILQVDAFIKSICSSSFSACRDQTHFHHRAGAEVAELVDDGKVEGEDDDADKKRKKKYSHASLTDNFCKLILDIIYE